MKTLALAVVSGLSLSACVTINTPMNGTGSSNNGNVVIQYPVETAFLNIYTKERNQKLVAVVDNRNIIADIKVRPKGAMLFNGKQVQGAEVSTLTTSNNQVIDQSVSTNYYTLNPLMFHGFTSNSGEYSVATQSTVIPKIAEIGDNNLLITENVYSDSSKRNKTGVYNQSWSLTQDSSNTAWLCVDTSANRLLSVDPDGATSECYKINAKGDILASRLTLDMPTQTIKFMSQ